MVLTNKVKEHTHVATDITGTAVLDDDSRLTDSRNPTAHLLSSHTTEEIVPIGSSSTLARLRLIGVYAASPADPPSGQVDIMAIDTGLAFVLRIRYNKAGVIKVGDLALV